MEFLKKTATELRKMLLAKEISSLELVEHTYERINNVEEKIGAYNSLTKESALSCAREVDKKIANGEALPPLAGIPLALKDNMNMKNTRTTASSKML
ncbi:glutamyl-tRNA(Gln) amidotransferase subunit A, partial [Candidatus Gastranaerophilus sp. (ex Termes propinquus)]